MNATESADKLTDAQRAALQRVAKADRLYGYGMLPRPGEALALRRLVARGLIVERDTKYPVRGPQKYTLTDAGRALANEAAS